MEDVTLRFSHLSGNIFNLLSNETIVNCMQVSRFLKNYLDNQKFLEIRKIISTVEQFHNVGKSWKRIFATASTAMIRDLRYAVGQFYKKDTNLNYFEGLAPLHVVAATGQLELFKKIIIKVDEKNPKDIDGNTPLQYATRYGHFEVCKYILNVFENKDFCDKDGLTPLHRAAQKGLFNICELIMTTVDNKNPKDNDGQTPLHFAVRYGHFELCQLFMDNLEEKNPGDNLGWTPLHLAALYGHLKIY